MVYCGTLAKEIIVVHPVEDETLYVIEMTKSAEEPVFWVSCNYKKDMVWEFYLENNSDYERVKYDIMDNLFNCDTMDELMNTLAAVFEDDFCAVRVINEECKCACKCRDIN